MTFLAIVTFAIVPTLPTETSDERKQGLSNGTADRYEGHFSRDKVVREDLRIFSCRNCRKNGSSLKKGTAYRQEDHYGDIKWGILKAFVYARTTDWNVENNAIQRRIAGKWNTQTMPYPQQWKFCTRKFTRFFAVGTHSSNCCGLNNCCEIANRWSLMLRVLTDDPPSAADSKPPRYIFVDYTITQRTSLAMNWIQSIDLTLLYSILRVLYTVKSEENEAGMVWTFMTSISGLSKIILQVIVQGRRETGQIKKVMDSQYCWVDRGNFATTQALAHDHQRWRHLV